MKNWLALTLSTALAASAAFAKEDVERVQQSGDVRELLGVSPAEAFERTQAVLGHFGVPEEPDSQAALKALDGRQSLDGAKARLKYLNRGGKFAGYSVLSSAKADVFQDLDAKKVQDYSVRFSSFDVEENRLHGASLAGLKIALDPGHMGGKTWDERTGKYVDDGNGHRLSEGVMALQVALLLEKELVRQGAKVFLTRRTLDSVSPLDYDSFDLKPWAKKELLESSLLDWFRGLLSSGPAGDKLYSAFEKSSDYKKLYTESMRWKYFVTRADLEARSDAIRDFGPDLMLDIHFDTLDPPGNPTGISKGHDATKAYVPGGFESTELASREDRKYFGLHLLDGPTWNQSVKLGRSIVKRIHGELGVPYDQSDSESAVLIEPGVIARNLAVTRKIPGVPTGYIECLFYNDPKEFEALRKQDFTMQIGGHSYPYSQRQVDLAHAIYGGVQDFLSAP